MRRNASDPKISLDKLPFSDMFLIREEFSNSDESDPAQLFEEKESSEDQLKARDNGTIVEEDESKSSAGRLE